MQIALQYAEARVVVATESKATHITLEIVKATPGDRIDRVQWGPIATSIKKKVGEVTAKMRMAITGLLTDEQKAALPKKGKGGKGKGKGKKKSDGDAKPKGGTQNVSLKLPGMT